MRILSQVCDGCGNGKYKYSRLCRVCSNSSRVGSLNPMFGRKENLSPVYKGGNPACLDCGEKIWFGSKRCKPCSSKGVLNPMYGKVAVRLFGKNNPMYGRTLEKNPNWQGGKSFVPYPLGWTNTFKEQVRFRDSYKCQHCGISEVEHSRKLHVHHIDCDKNNLSIENLTTLCLPCHSKEHNRLRREK